MMPKVRISNSNDTTDMYDSNSWNVSVEAKNTEQFDDLYEFVKENSLYEITRSTCPWDGEDGYHGEDIGCDKDECLKGEFVNEFRSLVKQWKKQYREYQYMVIVVNTNNPDATNGELVAVAKNKKDAKVIFNELNNSVKESGSPLVYKIVKRNEELYGILNETVISYAKTSENVSSTSIEVLVKRKGDAILINSALNKAYSNEILSYNIG